MTEHNDEKKDTCCQFEEHHEMHKTCAENCKTQINALLEQLEAAKDKYLRLFADTENMKRRTAEEQRLKIDLSQKKIFLDLLPIIDNFERAMKSSKEDQAGMKLIYGLFTTFLKQQGITEVATTGEFDPEIHEAISQVIDETKKSGNIVEVFEKGYYLHGKILRHAKVSVVT